MINYPPQTSLALIALGWKCLLVGKLIESHSQIITQNVQHIIKQCVWSDMLPVCKQLQVGLCKSPFIQVVNVVVTNSQILSFIRSLLPSCVCFNFLTMWRQKKELCKRLLPPYHSSAYFLQIILFNNYCMLDYVCLCMYVCVCCCMYVCVCCCMLFVYVRPWRRKEVPPKILVK